MDFTRKEPGRKTQGRKVLGQEICSPKTLASLFRLGRNGRDP
jgi:hypothetical protein